MLLLHILERLRFTHREGKSESIKESSLDDVLSLLERECGGACLLLTKILFFYMFYRQNGSGDRLVATVSTRGATVTALGSAIAAG